MEKGEDEYKCMKISGPDQTPIYSDDGYESYDEVMKMTSLDLNPIFSDEEFDNDAPDSDK